MKKIILSSIFSFFIILSISAADVISVADYAKIMKDPNLVTIDARKTADYDLSHVTGAISIYHNDLYKSGPIESLLKTPAELATIFGNKGVSNTSKIVVYDDGTGKYAGRIYWILKYLGATDVKVLDGNISAWKEARKPITKNPTPAKKATFTPSVKAQYLAVMNDVKAAKGNSSIALIDVREPAEFNGTKEDAKLREGHIPGAINIEFKEVLDAKGKLKSPEALKTLFESKGVTKDKTVILYCKTSVRAGIVFLALTSSLNYTNVKVYDGAFAEWDATSSNAVEK